MGERGQRPVRRRDPLSQSVIVRAAIGILDAEGADALTFRSLAARLSTGAGALYHHVANKDELLDVAAAELVGRVGGTGRAPGTAGTDVRAFVLSVYDLIDAHPWLGVQLARAPWQTAVLLVFEGVGERLEASGVPEHDRFDVASALVNQVLGAAAQNAAGARLPADVGRTAFLERVAGDWTSRGGRAELPFVHAIAAQLAHHDDRGQFARGVDLVLAGAEATRRAEPGPG